jgi:hypothetical protein
MLHIKSTHSCLDIQQVSYVNELSLNMFIRIHVLDVCQQYCLVYRFHCGNFEINKHRMKSEFNLFDSQRTSMFRVNITIELQLSLYLQCSTRNNDEFEATIRFASDTMNDKRRSIIYNVKTYFP